MRIGRDGCKLSLFSLVSTVCVNRVKKECMMRNQRKFERYSFSLSVHIKDKHGLHPIRTVNLSKYGLFLETQNPFPVRQLIKLLIKFPNNFDPIEALAQVMWVDETGDSERGEGVPGIGVKFFSMPDEDRQSWEQFVDMTRRGQIKTIDEKEKKGNKKKRKAKPDTEEEGGVHTIAEGELDELENIEGIEQLDEMEDLDLGDDEEQDEPDSNDVVVQDLSGALEEYEKDGDDVDSALEEVLEEIPDIDIEVEEVKEEPSENDNDAERRTYPRKKVSFKVKVRDVDAMREFFSKDISLGGIFLATSSDWKEGEKLDIVIVHPWTNESFSISAVVNRLVKSETERNVGIGVEFLNLDDSLRDTLLTYIESGFVIYKDSDDTPIESDIIRRIEEAERKVKKNPIDSSLHYELGLLYLCLSDWDKAGDHIDFAVKLGYDVPGEVSANLEKKQ